MELRRYLAIAWRWSWLFALGTVLAATAAFIVARGQTPVYQATSTVLIDQPTVGAGVTDVQRIQQLARTYGQIMTSDVVLDQVAKNVGMSTEELRPMVSATVQRETALIDVIVQNTDPQLTARLANEVVTTFAAHVKETTTGEQEAVIRELENQVAAAQTRVDDRQRLVTRLTAIPVGELTETQRQQLADGQFQLDILRQNLTTLQNQLQTLRVDVAKNSVTVTVPNPARVPESPVSPKVGQTTAIGGGLGLLLMVAIVLAIEYLDDTIKTGDDVTRVAKAPMLGAIPRIRGRRGETKSPLLTNYEGHSHVAEAYRILRTNLEFAHSGRAHQTMLVTSAVPSEGKSVTTANLALMLAQTGRRVLLVDADMRKPTQHFLFEVANTTGLSTLFVMDRPSVGGLLRATPMENLSLLTAGPPPPNPSELLASPRMQDILEVLKAEAEIVVFDSPPLLNVADTASLAAKVDGVVLVTDSTRTRSGAVSQAMETLNRAQATVWGVVLNKLSGQGNESYYYSASVVELARKHKVDLSTIRNIGLVSRNTRDVTNYIKQHAKEDGDAAEEPRPLPERRPFRGPRITAPEVSVETVSVTPVDDEVTAAADGAVASEPVGQVAAQAAPVAEPVSPAIAARPEPVAADMAEPVRVDETPVAAEAAQVEPVSAPVEHVPAAAERRSMFGGVMPRSRPLNGRRVNGSRSEARVETNGVRPVRDDASTSGGRDRRDLAARWDDRNGGRDDAATPELPSAVTWVAGRDRKAAVEPEMVTETVAESPEMQAAGVAPEREAAADVAAVNAGAEAASDLELVAALASAAEPEAWTPEVVDAPEVRPEASTDRDAAQPYVYEAEVVAAEALQALDAAVEPVGQAEPLTAVEAEPVVAAETEPVDAESATVVAGVEPEAVIAAEAETAVAAVAGIEQKDTPVAPAVAAVGGASWVMLDLDLTGVVASGRVRNPALSPLPYVLRAVTRAARQQPAMLGKAAHDPEALDVAVGVTLVGPNGLFTPVIRDADRLAPGEVQMRLQEVENRARDGRLLPWDLIGAELTLDASGLFDRFVFRPVLEPGQQARVSLAPLQEREGEHGPQVLGTLFLVFDEGVLSEAAATRFLEAVRDDLALLDGRRNGLPWHDPARAS